MKLTYEATLSDVAEPSIRLFLRGKTYATNLWRGTALCAAVFAVFAWLGFHAKENVNVIVVCAAAGVWGAGLYLLTYKGSVRRRIQKYVAGELNGSWPRTTDCEIKDATLISNAEGLNASFNLSDLVGVVEDSGYLELRFGDRGLCLIPLRAFESTDEKAAFVAAVQRSSTTGSGA